MVQAIDGKVASSQALSELQMKFTGSGKIAAPEQESMLTEVKDKQKELKLQEDKATLASSKKEFSESEMRSMEEIVNKMMEALQLQLRFSLHKNPTYIMVDIIDVNTKEVIRTLPLNALYKAFHSVEGLLGIMVDEKVGQ